MIEHASAAAADDSATAARAISRRGWLIRLAVAVLLLWPAWEVGRVLLAGNVHEIIPGRLYRGAQPSAQSLEAIIHQYHIRTVLNVRGCCFPDSWYVDEAAVCQQQGVYLEDITFSAVHLPSRDELRALVEVLDRAAYPIFVHCRHGSDRTGIAAAVAFLLAEGNSLADARRQLSLRFGHLPIGRTTMLDRFLDLYADRLRAADEEHTTARFRHWVLEEYRGGWCEAHFEKVERLFQEARVGEQMSYRVTVRNTGNATWQFHPLKTAGYHVVFKVTSDMDVIHEGRAGMLDARVPSGEKIQVMMIVPPILKKGRYRLIVDMIEEGHCWFHQTGSELWEEELVIRE
jgi:undecaprenyl-diphosphatase